MSRDNRSDNHPKDFYVSVPYLDSYNEPRPAPGLYLVATPIGNLGDISLRALSTLRYADYVACEDTRITAKLFQRYGLNTKRVAYHEHNAQSMRPKLISKLSRGAVIALVSDAGTPLISDPGFKLVAAAREANILVTSIPGASAVLTALQLSGLPSNRFLFAGFLDPKKAARRTELQNLSKISSTLVFFETGPRLAATLADMVVTLGQRDGVIARELTKRYEDISRAPIAELARNYANIPPPKGEMVVLVAPPSIDFPSETNLDQQLTNALRSYSIRDAVAVVAGEMGLPRRFVYARTLALTKKTS